MEIVIEGEQEQLQVEDNGLALGALIDQVEHFLQKKNKIPVGVSINKQELTEEELTERMHEVLEGSDTVTFQAMTLQEHALELIKGSHEATAALIALIHAVKGSLAQNQKGIEWDELTVELENFFLYWRKIAIAVPEGIDSIIVDGQSILVVIEGLLELCQNVVDGVEKGEFASVIQMFDEGVIPAIKKLDQAVEELQGILTQ